MRALLAAALATVAMGAAAHADLLGSEPADGGAVAQSPATIELRFNEPVRPIKLHLVDPAGAQVPLPPAQGDGGRIRVAVPQTLTPGGYTLSYRVTSLDSHPVEGAIAFGVGAPAPPRSAAVSPVSVDRVALRAVRDLALLLAAGGAFFVVLVGAFPGRRNLLGGTAALAATASMLAVPLQGVGLQSAFALSAGVACAGLALLAAGAWQDRRLRLAGGALLAVVSLTFTGHALTAEPALLAMLALLGHGLAAAFWLGSLAALTALLHGGGPDAAAALRRFSPFGMGAVGLLVVSGVTMAALRISAPHELLEAPYGRLVLAKATLLAVLTALAAANRYRLMPALESGAVGAVRGLRCTVAAEFALITAAVAITAALVQTPPPQAMRLALSTGARTVELIVTPGRAGANAIEVHTPGDAAEAVLDIANPVAGVASINRPMQRTGPGVFRLAGGEMAFPGTWELRIHLRVGDFEKLSFETKLELR